MILKAGVKLDKIKYWKYHFRQWRKETTMGKLARAAVISVRRPLVEAFPCCLRCMK